MVRSGFEVIEDSTFTSARGQFDGMKFIYNPETMTRLDFAHEWRHFGQLKQMIDRGITPVKSKNMRMANSPAEFGAYSYEQKLWERINVTPTNEYINFHSSQLEYFDRGLGSYRAQLSKPYNAKWRGIRW
jgi:hypothetical protein